MRRRGRRVERSWPTCPDCQEDLRPGARFCPRCGTPIAPGAERPPPRERPLGEDGRPEVPPPIPPPIPEPPPPRLWERFVPVLWLFMLLLASSIVMIVIYQATESESLLLELVIVAVDAFIIVLFVLADRRHIAPTLRKLGLGGARALVPVAVLAGMYVFAHLYFQIFAALGAEDIGDLDSYREQGWPIWSAFVMISVFPAVFEELAFRGFVQTRLERVVTPGEALLMQAAMFSVIHLLPLIFVSHFVLGIALGWLRKWSGSLYPGILVHGAYNALVLIAEIHGF